MNRTAKLYISVVTAAGVAVIGYSAVTWQTTNLVAFIVFGVLALAGAALKVRLPGISGTYSLNFLFILAGLPVLSLPEMIAIACASAPVQCLWRAKRSANALQLAFNVAGLAVSTAVAHLSYGYALRNGIAGFEQFGALALAATLYWAVNTGLISGVLTLLREGTLADLWQLWCFWSLPYYLFGAGLATLISTSVRKDDWRSALVFVPIAVLATIYYRVWVQRTEAQPESTRAASA